MSTQTCSQHESSRMQAILHNTVTKETWLSQFLDFAYYTTEKMHDTSYKMTANLPQNTQRRLIDAKIKTNGQTKEEYTTKLLQHSWSDYLYLQNEPISWCMLLSARGNLARFGAYGSGAQAPDRLSLRPKHRCQKQSKLGAWSKDKRSNQRD